MGEGGGHSGAQGFLTTIPVPVPVQLFPPVVAQVAGAGHAVLCHSLPVFDDLA